jgi:hypothetical protein
MHRLLIPLIVLTAWLPAEATESVLHSGQICQNYAAADGDYINNDADGTGNRNTSADLRVYCPVMGWQDTNNSLGVNRVRVYYRDQNDHGTHGGMSCVPFYTNASGATWSADTRHTCDGGTAGGCDTADPDHTGRGYLSWDDGVGEVLDNLGDLENTRSNIRGIGVYCVLPRDDGTVAAERSYVLHHAWILDN